MSMESSSSQQSPLSTQHSDLVVRVSDFVKRYKKNVAVNGVALEIRRGEIYGLIGPDGAGKSSLMKAIAGVLTYDEGTVEVFGTVIDSERAAERIKQRIGFLPQGLGLNLYPDLSVEENIDFFGRLRLVPEQELQERKRRLLGMTRLDKFRDRAMGKLSGGMKQKLGLICTLIHEPELAILDEPTTGVDPVSRRDFWTILAELLQERGMTVLVSTAYMDEASRFARLSFLSAGRVLTAGTPAQIQGLAPGSMVTFEAVPQLEALTRLQRDFKQVEALGPLLHVFVGTPDPTSAVQQIRKSLVEIEPNQVRVDAPELEDVFVSLLLRRRERPQALPMPTVTTRMEHPGLAIEARKLVRDFGAFRAVDQVTFQVNQGEIFGLLGANGAGKTTVIKMLNGILRPTGGEGWVAGEDMRTASNAIKQRIGYMSQAFSLYLDLTVVENIRLFAGIYGLGRREADERLRWIVTMAGLKGYESDLTGGLPMGVRQRLALGCALVHQPRVLFLDEPTSGVDPIGRRLFWDILSRLSRDEGVGILITTHYMSEAEHCDTLALMYAGRVVAGGTPTEMKQQMEQEAGHLLELTTDQPAAAVKALHQAGCADAALFGNRVHVLCAELERDESRLRDVLARAGIAVGALAVRPVGLEDVFVYRVMALERLERRAA